jgi:hypothetical protein
MPEKVQHVFKKIPMVDQFMGQIEHSTSQMQGGFPQLFAWLASKLPLFGLSLHPFHG